MKLAGKVVLVTGASSGIGRASAIALAKEGADIALNYLTMPESAETAKKEIEALGRKCLLYPVDLVDQAAVETMVADAVHKLGKIDTLVSSAVFSDRNVPCCRHERFPQNHRCFYVGSFLYLKGMHQPNVKKRQWRQCRDCKLAPCSGALPFLHGLQHGQSSIGHDGENSSY